MTDKGHTQYVRYQHTIEYTVVNSLNIFHRQNLALLSMGRLAGARRFVVIDSNVEKYYSAAIRDYFAYYRIDAKIVAFPGGEENKTIDRYLSIVRELDTFPITRGDEPIIAIG